MNRCCDSIILYSISYIAFQSIHIYYCLPFQLIFLLYSQNPTVIHRTIFCPVILVLFLDYWITSYGSNFKFSIMFIVCFKYLYTTVILVLQLYRQCKMLIRFFFFCIQRSMYCMQSKGVIVGYIAHTIQRTFRL